MPKTRMDLSKILQVRVSQEGMAAIEKAAANEQTTIAEFSRRALYQASKFTRTRPVR